MGIFKTIKDLVSGYKLYLTAIAAIATATVAWSSGALDTIAFVESIYVALGFIWARAAIAKQ